PLPIWSVVPVPDTVFQTAYHILSFLVPVLGYLFVLFFLDIRLSPFRVALAVLPLLVAVAALAPGQERRAPYAALGALFLLAGELLGAVAREPHRHRGSKALLFAGTAALVLSALVDAAASRQIVVPPPFLGPLVGPAFV